MNTNAQKYHPSWIDNINGRSELTNPMVEKSLAKGKKKISFLFRQVGEWSGTEKGDIILVKKSGNGGRIHGENSKRCEV